MPLQLNQTALIVIALLAVGAAIWLFIAAVRHRRRMWVSILLLMMPAFCLLCSAVALVPSILSASQTFQIRAAPVPDSTMIYYLTAAQATDIHPVVTLNVFQGRTGKLVWQRVMPSTSNALASDGNTLYAVSHSYSSNDSLLVALNLATGAVRWQETLTHLTGSSLLLTHGVLFMAAVASGVPPGGELLALRPSDGARLWTASLPAAYGYLPSLSATDDTLVFQSDAYAYESLSLTDGHILWSGRPEGSIVVGPHAVYELAGYGSTVARDSLTGATLWQYGDHEMFHAGVVSGDMLYVTAQHSGTVTDGHGNLSNPETLYALTAATGRLRWKFATQSGNYGTLLASANTVYIHADDGIHALRASDGSVRWHSDPHNNWTFALSPVTGPLIFVSALQTIPASIFTIGPSKGQMYLYAVNEADGSADWGVPVGPVITIYPHWVL